MVGKKRVGIEIVVDKGQIKGVNQGVCLLVNGGASNEKNLFIILTHSQGFFHRTGGFTAFKRFVVEGQHDVAPFG